MTEALIESEHVHVSEDVLTWEIPGGKTVTVHSFASPAESGAHLGGLIARSLSAAIDRTGKAIWLGCGGSTPKPVYSNLVYADLEWSNVTLVQVDERFVPTDDVNSNTRMMREALAPAIDKGLDLVSLIQDISDQNSCAAKAEAKLLELGQGEAPQEGPMYDFALMGMGPDAHYASIFPNHPLNAFVYDTRAQVLPVKAKHDGSEPVLPRITLSVPAINRCRHIVFYITGQAKLDVLTTMSVINDPQASPIGAFLAQCPARVDFVWNP